MQHGNSFIIGPSTNGSSLMSGPAKVDVGKIQGFIIDALAEEPLPPSEVVKFVEEKTGANEEQVRVVIVRMVDHGEIDADDHWRLVRRH